MAHHAPGPVQRVFLIAVIVVLCLPLTKAAREMFADEDTARDSAAWRIRHATLARAKVFVDNGTSIGARDLSVPPNDPHPFDPKVRLDCHYVSKKISGTTPKFDCELPGGEVVKVKYGWTPERHGEVAATRILAALGFGADRVQFIERLRCYGCPPSPFRLRQILDFFYAAGLADLLVNHNRYRDYEWVTVERKLDGTPVEVGDIEGWGWFDLERVKEAAGGAPIGDVDALRLIAILIADWDNKEPNQRLLCLGEEATGDEMPPCRRPLVMLQDVGATFGPTKVNYRAWKAAAIWKDEAACVVSMESFPHGGGTFLPVKITEAGRQTLANRLNQLTDAQLTAAFRSARFPIPEDKWSVATDVSAWVQLFREKARQISSRPACPQ
ncbi:MAG TPA: hypothetical protein VFV98_09000 [Vicinamibacterales bacterium]|nr:hypothetical protein [Vicinamibacterales bacterium]